MALALALFLVLALSACADDNGEPAAETDAEDRVDVIAQLTFTVNGSHAHLYAADEQGYFAEEGINVTFREGSGAEAVLAGLATAGERAFGISPLNQAASAITEGLPLIAVAGWNLVSPSVLVAKPETPLDRPEDLVGLTVGLKQGLGAQFIFDQFLETNGIDADQVDVRIVDPGAANAIFLRGDVDVVDAFLTNEVPTLEAELDGERLNTLLFADWGFPDLGQGAVAHRDLVEEDPELVQGFVRAASRGIEFMIENPEEVARIVFERYSATLPSEEIVLGQIRYAIELTPHPGGGHLYGWLDPEAWQTQIDTASERGTIQDPLPVNEYYTNEFVE